MTDTAEKKYQLDAERVKGIFESCLCLFDESQREELLDKETGKVLVEGIMIKVYLDKFKLEHEYRPEIEGMLLDLPDQFHADKGGGWSFLNACDDRRGNQWTGLHAAMDQLFMLGIGIDFAQYQLPREMWSGFPGGMPYVSVGPQDRSDDTEST